MSLKMATDELVNNCISWPDFQDWEKDRNVGIINEKMKKKIGLFTKLNVRNGISYHIIDQVSDRKPASGKVEVGHWIVGVDGKPTTGIDTNGLTQLIKEQGKEITLSIRTPKFGLMKDTLHWWQNIVELTIDQEYFNEISFCHFYTKVNGEDKLLCYEKAKILEGSVGRFCLHRGDELVSVNGIPVKEKKWDKIKKGITETSSSTVKLSIKKIVLEGELEAFLDERNRQKTAYIDLTADSIDFLLQTHSSFANSYFHIVTEVRDFTTASPSGLCVGDQLVAVNGTNVTNLKNTEVIDFIKNQKGVLKLALIAPEGSAKVPCCSHSDANQDISDHSRKLSGTNVASINVDVGDGSEPLSPVVPSQEIAPTKDESSDINYVKNVDSIDVGLGDPSDPFSPVVVAQETASENTERLKSCISGHGEVVGKSQSENILCSGCNGRKRTRLPNDKTLWPVTMICPTNFKNICDKLDQDIVGMNVDVFAECLGFSPHEIRTIYQKFSNHGGIGAAEAFLRMWSNKSKDNNIGKVQNIVSSEQFRRDDVGDEIDEWLKREDICFGCGAVISS